MSAERQRFEGAVVATGLLVPAVQSKINFRISGVFRDYKAGIGDHVDAGQVLAELDAPDQDLAIASAKYDMANAKAGLDIAMAKLTAIQNGPRAGSVDQASGTLAKAQAKLAATQGSGRNEDVATKQAALDAAKAKLALLVKGPRPEAVAQAQAALDEAQAKLKVLQQGPRPEQQAVLKTQVEQAKNSLLAAQLTRDAACGLSKGGACDSANAQVNAAQNGIDLANQQMALALAPPRPTDLAAAQARVDSAQQGLGLAQAPYTPEDVQQQKDVVAQAEQAVALAQRPFDAHDVAQAQGDVQTARGALDVATAPYLETDLAQAQAAVDQAQAQLELSQAKLANATLNQGYERLTAPYAGTVLAEVAKPGEHVGADGVATTAVSTSRGEAVSVAGNAAMLLASDEGLKVNADVDERDIVHISLGQPVDVAFDALPGVSYPGKVMSVPPADQRVQNIPQYVVEIALTVPSGSPAPRPGMTATCTLAYSRDNVLALPTSALQDKAGQSVVTIRDSAGATRQATVQTGARNNTLTEIVSGLQAGQQVIVPSPAASH